MTGLAFLGAGLTCKNNANTMNTTFILKALKSNKSEGGFTLIELLVVIIIIGILSAIALPSFLNQTSKAKEVNAKTTVSAVNGAQNAFRVENSSFAPDMEALALGLPSDTTNYTFEVVGNQDTATITATSKDTALKGYVGGVVRYGLQGQSAIASVVCQAKTAGTTPPVLPNLDPSEGTPETAAKCNSTQVKL